MRKFIDTQNIINEKENIFYDLNLENIFINATSCTCHYNVCSSNTPCSSYGSCVNCTAVCSCQCQFV